MDIVTPNMCFQLEGGRQQPWELSSMGPVPSQGPVVWPHKICSIGENCPCEMGKLQE